MSAFRSFRICQPDPANAAVTDTANAAVALEALDHLVHGTSVRHAEIAFDHAIARGYAVAIDDGFDIGENLALAAAGVTVGVG
jgi:hypothetical protein